MRMIQGAAGQDGLNSGTEGRAAFTVIAASLAVMFFLAGAVMFYQYFRVPEAGGPGGDEVTAGPGEPSVITVERFESGKRSRDDEELIEKMKASLNAAMGENTRLNGELESLRAEADRLRTVTDNQLNRISFQTAEAERLRAAARRENDSLAAEIGDMEARLTALREELESARAVHTEESEALRSEIEAIGGKLAEAYKDQEALKEQVEGYQEGSLVMEVARMHYNTAQLFKDNRDYVSAAREYKRALELDPADPDTHYNLAVVADVFLTDYSTAYDHYKRYLELEPNAENRKGIEERIFDLELRIAAEINPPLTTPHAAPIIP